jgi:hypothetical protein
MRVLYYLAYFEQSLAFDLPGHFGGATEHFDHFNITVKAADISAHKFWTLATKRL